MTEPSGSPSDGSPSAGGSSGRVDRIVGASLLLFGLATGLEASTFNVAFMTDPIGPKALPWFVAALLIGAGVRLLVVPRPSVPLPGRAVVLRMAAATLAFLVYALLLPWIGFFTSTAMVVAALALLYSGPRWPSVAAGLAVSGALWLLFVALLSLPLPVGDLWIR